MKPRSPVLGYNHNVRYAQRLWHVQTEDSGVANPHIFTHLFHDGTILATKRLDYDPNVAVDIVQKLMQAQHKALLRELKQGQFDDKIGRFFGTPVVRDPVAEGERPGSGEFDADSKTDPAMAIPESLANALARPATSPAMSAAGGAQAPPSGTARTDASVPAMAPPRAPAGAPALRPPPAPASPPAPRTTTRPNLTPSRPAVPVTASRTAVPAAPPRPPVTGIGGRRPAAPPAAHSYGGGKPTAEGVVVARPAVIVGDQGPMQRPAVTAPRQPRHTPPPPAAGPQPSKTPTGDNIFGGDLISEKSLDEVILAYLSEDLNEK